MNARDIFELSYYPADASATGFTAIKVTRETLRQISRVAQMLEANAEAESASSASPRDGSPVSVRLLQRTT